MFTGIVEEIGTVAEVTGDSEHARLRINAGRVLEDAALGDSIAVNGVCLTIASKDDSSFSADVMRESLDRSTLGELQAGSPVNLERALAASNRLGGHIMQGHVDTTVRLKHREHTDNWDILRFELPQGISRYVVEKGSIAVAGTSLTVSALGEDYFEVSLIPTTLEQTILGELAEGARVNLEVDILGKYVERMLAGPDAQVSQTGN
ncbi:riboflavin synthase [Corynebacterium yudongzhengii]|uniref:Riboflavin synthase n=1 Tax=Corynebacterium yudongzhengii TaxID=2080740 RepID=A0A2U1T8M6_9CORY|nr:riboflavin synthase [Corynebacterium yudongzhengii]AWB81845.1 riboflavin synthase [Corynebacterium yudongzhengii]PWC02238.1 riboflavin synthase [Corynebacterium yudongzhengii]